MDILIIILQILLVGLGTLLFGIIFNASTEELPYMFLMGTLCRGAYVFFYMNLDSMVLATFFAALIVSLVSIFLSKSKNKPLPVFLTAGILPILPGYSIFKTILGVVEGKPNDIFTYGILTLQSLTIITLSVIIASSVSKMLTYLKKTLT